MCVESKEEFLSNFGKKVSELRKSANISQEQLACDAEIDTSTLSRIERGNYNPSIYIIFKIALVLKIHPKELLDF